METSGCKAVGVDVGQWTGDTAVGYAEDIGVGGVLAEVGKER